VTTLSGAIRFARSQLEMRSFFGDPITFDDARRTVADQMERRNENFLWMLEHNVFGYPKSPYRPLFSLAEIEFEDVKRELAVKGLEGTLRSLREAGVYVTFEEVKGRQFPCRERASETPASRLHTTA
jgi:hypothetical protein